MKTFKQFVVENEVKTYEYKWKTKSSRTWNNLFNMKTLDKSFEDTIPSYLTELVKSKKVNPSMVEFAVFVSGDKMVWSKDAYCDNVLFYKKQKIKMAYIVEVIAQHNIYIEDYELKANRSGKYIVQEIQNNILYAIPFDILDNMKDPEFDNIVWDEIDEKYRERVKIDLNSVLVKILHKTKQK